MNTESELLWEGDRRIERRRALIVDDDPDFTRGLINQLEEWQWDTKVVARAADVPPVMDEFQPEIVLIDLSIGRERALDLVMTLKSHRPDLIAILIAAEVETGLAVEALRSGSDDFFSKPVRPDDLSAALERSVAKLAVIRQKQAFEEALYDSELRYRQLVETTPDSTFVHSGGTIMFLNPTAVQLLGFDVSDDVIGKQLTDFMHPQDVAGFVAASENFDRTWLPQKFPPLRIVRSNAEVRVVEPYAARIDYKGWPAQLIVARDVTEARKAEERLRQTQKLEVVSHLTAGIAHDFNNLLGVVIANLHTIKRIDPTKVPDAAAKTAEIADSAIEAAQRGAKMVENLLAFARNQPLTMVATDANRFVDRFLEMFHQSIDFRIQLQTDLKADPAVVMVDRTQLLNAMLNLIVNARHAMPDGGTVTVSTSNIRYRTDPDSGEVGDFVSLSVTDDGVGMNDEVRQRAFDPFYTTREKGNGSGLGLSMVYGFAKQSGGDATIESEPGKGTTVSILLPLFEEAAEGTC